LRRAAKVDANQGEIVKALRKVGVDVEIIGLPVDLLCGYHGRNFLLEVKDKAGRLTKGQKEFMEQWRGQVRVVRTAEEAIRVVTSLER
jgi:hypothetical protein